MLGAQVHSSRLTRCVPSSRGVAHVERIDGQQQDLLCSLREERSVNDRREEHHGWRSTSWTVLSCSLPRPTVNDRRLVAARVGHAAAVKHERPCGTSDISLTSHMIIGPDARWGLPLGARKRTARDPTPPVPALSAPAAALFPRRTRCSQQGGGRSAVRPESRARRRDVPPRPHAARR